MLLHPLGHFKFQEETLMATVKAAALPIYADEVRATCVRRLKAAEGQLRGLQEMIDGQRPCIEVLTQLAAVQSALRQVSRIVLRNYLEKCASEAIRRSDPAVYGELMDAFFKFSQ